MIKAIVPIKSNSERLKGKNFKSFCGQPLYQVVLDTLQNIELVESIIINTDSIEIASECSKKYSKVVVIERPLFLIGDNITMNTIIDFDLSKVSGEHFLQTHVTNPLITAKTIASAIKIYFEKLDIFDSLFSVDQIKKRVYDQNGNPLNHTNLTLEQTQKLPPINIENSNLFLFSRTSFFSAKKSRIGLKPQLFKMSSFEGIDIDYEEDFLLAELIAKNRDIFNFFG
ncbi:MAG: acylneuraminate cytidylyltransferase family protein [Bacteroidota bacterium]|nr:acylneuraminate cytidylyltransferase family protein [Bacteroidota bacterium]